MIRTFFDAVLSYYIRVTEYDEKYAFVYDLHMRSSMESSERGFFL